MLKNEQISNFLLLLGPWVRYVHFCSSAKLSIMQVKWADFKLYFISVYLINIGKIPLHYKLDQISFLHNE